MKCQRIIFIAASLMMAEAGFLSALLGSQNTRLGLEASAGFLRSSRKAAGWQEFERPSAAEVESAIAAQDGSDLAVVLMQQEAVAIVGSRKQAAGPGRFEADLLAATKKLEELPIKPLDSNVLSGNLTAGNDSAPFQRVSAAQKWEEIKAAQDEAKKAAIEEGDILTDDSVKHLLSWEATLIQNIASGEEEHAQPCIAHCRYGEEVRHTWEECVERCVEDGMTKRLLLVGLPEKERAAVHLDAPAPAGMDEMKKKRTARKRARSEDL